MKKVSPIKSKTPAKEKTPKQSVDLGKVRVPEGAVLHIVMSEAEWRKMNRSRSGNVRG